MEDLPICPRCGRLLVDNECAECKEAPAIVPRELVQLLVLLVAAIVLFWVTRSLQVHAEHENTHAGEAWFGEGQVLLRVGDTEAAVGALRKAVVAQRGRLDYTLSLTRALAASDQRGEAWQILQRERRRAPENPEVNLQLARLAAGRDEPQEAIRYYRSTLYAIWPEELAAERRQVRLELVRYLLDQGQALDAQAELLAARRFLPDESRAYAEVGRLFLDAGDPGDALLVFGEAIRLDPGLADAHAGAGDAEFAQGQYVRAARHYRAALARESDAPGVRDRLTVAEGVGTSDPLAPRLASSERERRLRRALTEALDVTLTCRIERPSIGGDTIEVTIEQAHALLTRMKPGLVRREPEVLDSGVDLVFHLLDTIRPQCPFNPPIEALYVMASRHQPTEG